MKRTVNCQSIYDSCTVLLNSSQPIPCHPGKYSFCAANVYIWTPITLKKILAYIFAALLFATPLFAQVNAKQYSFFHHGVSGGLASNEVLASVQDAEGYIWIGTNNGLQRFDGTRYLTFRTVKDDKWTIPDNHIYKLFIDKKKKNLWILTTDGKIGIFDTKWLSYHQVTIKSKNERTIYWDRKLMEDEEGNIILILADEMLTWNEEKNEFAAEHNPFQLPADWKYGDIKQQPGTKKYWISRKEGIAIFNRQTGKLSYDGHNEDKEAIIDQMGKIPMAGGFLFDQKGRVWFSNWGGGMPNIFAFDLKKNIPILSEYTLYHLVQTYHELRAFVEQKDGTIWVHGLRVFARYREDKNDFQMVMNGYTSEQSISYDIVTEVNEDREQNLWVGTTNNGIYRFNPASQFFTNVRQLSRFNKVPGEGSNMSFMMMKDSTVLVGTWSDGVYRYNKNYDTVPVAIPGLLAKHNPYVWSMWRAREGNRVWMGAQPGVFLYDEDTRKLDFYNPPVMDSRTVRAIAEDKNGNLWLGTQSKGVFKWTAKKGKPNFNDGVTQFKPISQGLILEIEIDSEGYVWIGTADMGVFRIDPDTDEVVQHFGRKEPPERRISWDGVPDILQYNDTTILIAARNIHVFNTRTKVITRTINLPESIPADVRCMEKDRMGYIWMSLTNGIYRINPRNGIFIHFDRIDGIANDHFIIGASYMLPNGRIIFGADNQMVVFDPTEVKINDPSPNIVITDFKLMNKPLLVDSLLGLKRLELAPDDNSVTIGFSGLRYNGTYIIRYMLEGLDKEWKTADASNMAVYSYLPPGTYTFLARGEDAEGNPSSTTTRLVIRVKPPFWKTWWFLGLVIFAATAVLFWLDKLRMQRLRATESIRTRIATSLTEDMSNSLSNINISSELAKAKIETDTYRTKEYINQISETSNRMVQAMYDMVWSIDPKNDTMANTIERMKSFAVETENTFPINIEFDITKQVEQIGLDMEHRYELLSIFKEALTNAGKHSGGRYVKVSIRYSNSKMIMMIVDDGRGFSMDDAAMLGRGMSDMRRRAAAINASLYIESEINTGTVIKLEMPVSR